MCNDLQVLGIHIDGLIYLYMVIRDTRKKHWVVKSAHIPVAF